jgi:hypothetical protein
MKGHTASECPCCCWLVVAASYILYDKVQRFLEVSQVSLFFIEFKYNLHHLRRLPCAEFQHLGVLYDRVIRNEVHPMSLSLMRRFAMPSLALE